MPTATRDGVSLYYEVDGDDGPVVVFVGDVGTGAWLWSWQAPALAGVYRTVVWDARGTGRSDAASPYSVTATARDLEAVLGDAGIPRVAVVGAGVGGLVALEYVTRFDRADRLVLLGSAAGGGCVDADAYRGGPASLDQLLSESFRAGYPDAVEWIIDRRREEDADPSVIDDLLADLAMVDHSGDLHAVTEPALVLHGQRDAVVPVEAARDLVEGLPRGRFEGLEAGSHWCFIEQARLATALIEGFLDA